MAAPTTIGLLLTVLVPALVTAAVVSAGLIVLLMPWLERHALARQTSRSSHQGVVPQGGGIAVIVAALALTWGALASAAALPLPEWLEFFALTIGALMLLIVGVADDMLGVPAWRRLVVQCIAVALPLAALPADFHIVPMLPLWIERAALFVGGVWLVNLTNFMDGIDWMTVAEAAPITAAVVLLGFWDAGLSLPMLLAAALLGGLLGFAPFNKPVARLFLGDAGSLPIGLLLFWLLVQLAGRGHIAAAVLLPLYYLADATLTLLRRLIAGEAVWEAHRTHFYQRARDGGFTVREIVARVFLVNVALGALALATVALPGAPTTLAALAAGSVLVAVLLVNFARGKRRAG